MIETRLWLIRHAESTWNAVGRWQGQADPPLSELGRRQAQSLADALRGERLEVLVASDLARAAETAEIVADGLSVAVRFEPRLRELDAGAWSGLSRAEIAARDGEALRRFDSEDRDAPAGGAESRADVKRRAREVLREWLPAGGQRRIAFLSHEGVLGSLLPGLQLGNAEWRVAERAELDPAD